MKILVIGQLPKEIGGNYTTGAANVVYELSKSNTNSKILFTYGTNINNRIAKKISSYNNQYIGYNYILTKYFIKTFLHPYKLYNEVKHYINIDHLNPIRLIFYRLNIQRSIDIIQPDLIHVHSISNLSSVYFAKESDIPILLTCHGIFFRGDASDSMSRERYLGNIKFADYYTGLTVESLHEYNEYLNVESSKITIIPNGVDCKKFFFSNNYRSIIRDEMNCQSNTIVFLTVASLQKRKGQYDFLEILEELAIDYQYWLIGDGNDKDIILDYVLKKRLQNRIKILGYMNSDELYKYYSAADIYAHTSLKEGQALSEIEAYATGMRILVNSVVKKTVVGNISDNLYYFYDEKSNIEDIRQWIFKKNDYRKSRNNYDWHHISEAYLNVYNKMLKR